MTAIESANSSLPIHYYRPQLDQLSTYDSSVTDILLREQQLIAQEPGKRGDAEVIQFFGCTHGEVGGRIYGDVVVITDVPGSPFVAATQVPFYEDFAKPAARILERDPEISDEHFLGSLIDPWNPGMGTLFDGYKRMVYHQYRMDTSDEGEILQRLSDSTETSPAEAVAMARLVSVKQDGRYPNRLHGVWMRTLSRPIRQRIIAEFAAHTKAGYDMFIHARDTLGIRLIDDPGNWEMSYSIAGIAYGMGGEEDVIENFFRPIDYMIDHNVEFYLEPTGVETKKTLLLLLNFDWGRDFLHFMADSRFADRHEQTLERLDEQVRRAREQNKRVGLHMHGAKSPWAYDLMNAQHNSAPNERFAHTAGVLMERFLPDQVVTSHYHHPMIGKDGEILPLSAQLVYKVGERRRLELVTDEADLPDPAIQKIHEAYTPKHHHATWVVVGPHDENLPAQVVSNV